MNRIHCTLAADLSLTSFRTAGEEVQRVDGEDAPLLLIAHPGEGRLLTEITRHYQALKASGHRAEGAFIIPPSVNAWYHEGLPLGAWMVLGRDNFVYVEGV